jgi:AcrR family transcriptional regulator
MARDQAGSRSRKRRSYHHGDLRAALIAAARAIVEAEGMEAASLREAARRAGVSQAAPYHQFADKEALLAAVAEQGFEELTAAMTSRAEAAKTEAAGFDATGVGYVCFAAANPGLFRLMFGRPLAREGFSAAAARAYEVLERGVRRMLPKDAAAEDVKLASLRAWSIVHGLAKLILETGITPSEYGARDVEALATRLLARPQPNAKR